MFLDFNISNSRHVASLIIEASLNICFNVCSHSFWARLLINIMRLLEARVLQTFLVQIITSSLHQSLSHSCIVRVYVYLHYAKLRKVNPSVSFFISRWRVVALQRFYSEAFNFNVNLHRWARDAIQALFHMPYNTCFDIQRNIMERLQCLISHVRHSISIIRLVLCAQNMFHSPAIVTLRCAIEITTMGITITHIRALTVTVTGSPNNYAFRTEAKVVWRVQIWTNKM